MTLSPAFTARMMKEQKMFSFNAPPGSGHAFRFIVGAFVWPVKDSLFDYHCGVILHVPIDVQK